MKKPVTYKSITQVASMASKTRDLRQQKVMQIEKLLRGWKPPDMHEGCKKEISHLKATLDELVEAYEMMSYSGNHLKEFNDALHRAKKLINY